MIRAKGKTKVLGATRMHWADRRASVAVPDSLSDAQMAGIGAFEPSGTARSDAYCAPKQTPAITLAIGGGRVMEWPPLRDGVRPSLKASLPPSPFQSRPRVRKSANATVARLPTSLVIRHLVDLRDPNLS